MPGGMSAIVSNSKAQRARSMALESVAERRARLPSHLALGDHIRHELDQLLKIIGGHSKRHHPSKLVRLWWVLPFVVEP